MQVSRLEPDEVGTRTVLGTENFRNRVFTMLGVERTV